MQEFLKFIISAVGRYSSVRIATELRATLSRDRIPVQAILSAPVQIGTGAHPAYITMGTVSFPGVNNGLGVTLISPLLVSWSGKSRAVPLLPLWPVRPVQSLSACKREKFTSLFLLSAAPQRAAKRQRCNSVCTAEWSRGCGTGLQNGYVALVPDCRVVT